MLMSEQQMVSGIICLTCNPNLRIPKGIPTVSIDRSLGPGIACVASDNFGGGCLAAQKLLENGCKRLAFLRTGSFPAQRDRQAQGRLHPRLHGRRGPLPLRVRQRRHALFRL